jgi:type I restriction enzyme R subunit
MRARCRGPSSSPSPARPLIAGEERTREVFGDYVSIYDFQQSVEDGATVPLFYENRTPELQAGESPTSTTTSTTLIEAAELDEAQEAKLERELGRQYHMITRDDRLDTVAQDIVRHFLGRGFSARRWWSPSTRPLRFAVRQGAEALGGRDRAGSGRRLAGDDAYRRTASAARTGRADEPVCDVLKTTDMAVIVSPGQNEIEQMRSWASTSCRIASG